MTRFLTGLTLVFVVLLITATAAPAHADPANELTGGSFDRALRSASANALTEDNLHGATLAYARRLPLAPLPGLQLWGTANLGWGVTEGTMFQTLTTEVDTAQYTFGARARYALFRDHVVATARLDLGTQRSAVVLRDEAGHSAADASWGAVGIGALGVDLLAVTHRRFSLGVRAELGYVAASAVELTARAESPADDTLELDRMAASLGHLDLGGRYFAVTVVSQF
ncbi:MAG: hypothetical protein H0X17_22110 [Deltaproteobacteria bacterium]|nr:hypothetical protein [Deltaproteobacteria bacterium]